MGRMEMKKFGEWHRFIHTHTHARTQTACPLACLPAMNDRLFTTARFSSKKCSPKRAGRVRVRPSVNKSPHTHRERQKTGQQQRTTNIMHACLFIHVCVLGTSHIDCQCNMRSASELGEYRAERRKKDHRKKNHGRLEGPGNEERGVSGGAAARARSACICKKKERTRTGWKNDNVEKDERRTATSFRKWD